ncbi:MAG: helix-turn-helix transcriptional regulator [Candidatus Sumerlaeota bacterium]|nr:helix-turn-helix transcriptional regulator [Candidatus Sumerlaeota bacterium]
MKKYRVAVLSEKAADDSIPIEKTDFWAEMESNRTGNLLAGARLKAGLTQTKVAELMGVRQNMISDYERGQRPLSAAMARRFSKMLHINVEHLMG